MSGDRGIDVTVPASLAMLKKHPDLNLILVGKQGAGYVKQHPSGPQQWPNLIQHTLLLSYQIRDILLFTQQLDVRVTPNDPGCRAGDI